MQQVSLAYIIIYIFSISCSAQSHSTLLTKQLDEILEEKVQKPFNGAVLITQHNKPIYQKIMGFSDLETKEPLRLDNEFIVGSISKQFTAVLILQAYEAGRLRLDTPIKTYLTTLTQPWADFVTIHQLLTHTHGIVNLEEPTLFTPGLSYAYSQIGYQLLADILEKVNGKSFVEQSADLFQKHQLNSSYHPDYKKTHKLNAGYSEAANGELIKEGKLTNYVAAGGFISTATDLARWNSLIYKGHLLQDSTYTQMTTKHPNAVRNHPMFGETAYGYGVTVDTKENILQLGLTGYVPGYISLNFYFPDTDVSVVVLENVTYDLDDFQKTFTYHLAILNAVRQSKLIRKKS